MVIRKVNEIDKYLKSTNNRHRTVELGSYDRASEGEHSSVSCVVIYNRFAAQFEFLVVMDNIVIV